MGDGRQLGLHVFEIEVERPAVICGSVVELDLNDSESVD